MVDYILYISHDIPIKYPLNHHSYPEKKNITIKPLPKIGPTFGQMSSAQEIRQLPCHVVGSGTSRRTGAPFDRWISGENQWDFVDFEWTNGIIAPRKITCSMDSFMEKSAETCRNRVC